MSDEAQTECEYETAEIQLPIRIYPEDKLFHRVDIADGKIDGREFDLTLSTSGSVLVRFDRGDWLTIPPDVLVSAIYDQLINTEDGDEQTTAPISH